MHQQNFVAETSASGSFPSNGEKPETAKQAQSNTFRSQPVAKCERICQHCANKTAFFKPSDEMDDHNENSTQQQVDSHRARFLSYYFFLFDVKRLRRTLHFIKGDKRKTWSIFIDSLSGENLFFFSLFFFFFFISNFQAQTHRGQPTSHSRWFSCAPPFSVLLANRTHLSIKSGFKVTVERAISK